MGGTWAYIQPNDSISIQGVTMTHTIRGICLTSLLLTLGALTAQADTLADAQARYKAEMAACAGLSDKEESQTCRLEARNALAEAKRKDLDAAPLSTLQSNQSQRCEVHAGDERAACEARMRGEGHTEGSVREGGILREIVRPEPPEQ